MSIKFNFLLKRAGSGKSRSLLGACLTHILHDGYTDQLYAFLPVWQAQFGLSYMGLAIVRALYYGTMGGVQVPAVRCTNGAIADHSSQLTGILSSACTAVIIVPLVLSLRTVFASSGGGQ